LLFTGYHSIYLVNAKNLDLQSVYTNGEYIGFDPFWLTDNIILFNAYKDYSTPPDIYSLNINSKSATQLFPGGDYFIQTTFPSEKKWLRGNWNTGNVDTVDQEGKTEKFFNDFSVVTDPFSTYPKFQRINRLDKYLFQAKKSNETDYKLWLLSKQNLPEILFDLGGGGIDKFAVSPNEQYVALTYVSSKNVYVYIFDLNSLQLVQQWIYPYKRGAADFIWSPDSRSIVLPYSDGSSTATGLQTMDIMTGRTNVLLKDNVDQILDWP
jgi:Tol biopolymer transport system component